MVKDGKKWRAFGWAKGQLLVWEIDTDHQVQELKEKGAHANGGPGEKIGAGGRRKCPPIICEGARNIQSLRKDKGSQIVNPSSEMEATITEDQEQLKRTRLPIAEFMPIEMPC